MVRLAQLPKGLALALLAVAHVSAVPSIDVSMRAAFPAAPYLIELIETAAGENATAYFPLLDRLASGYFDAATTDKELYEKFLEVLTEDGHMVQPEALSTFKLALSMRSAAPRIEAHYQYFATGVEPKLEGTSQDGCEAWALFNELQHCAADLKEPRGEALSGVHTKALPFDRTLGSGPPAILYADISSPSFRPFHNSLVGRARRGELSYRLRHRRAGSSSPRASASYDAGEALPVSGYGVELALKKTDYIVIDDREADTAAEHQKAGGNQVVLGGEEDVADLKPLSKAELLSLGLKTSSFIMKSKNRLETLLQLSQDFPKYSTQMAGQNASMEFIDEHETKLEMVPSGANVLWMNGVQLIERQIEPFTLVDMLRRERKLIEGVKKLGLTGKQAVALLGHSNVTQAKVDDEPLRFDWRDELEEGKVIMWLNDIEKDERYEDFPKNLMTLLQRTYPGQIPSVRRDIFNLVVPLDFSKPEDIKVAMQLDVFVNRMLPIRFGLVPLEPTVQSIDIAKVLYYLYSNYNIETLTSYLELAMGQAAASADKDIFAKAVEGGTLREEGKSMTFDEVLEWEVATQQTQLAKQWTDRLKANTAVPPVFINGMAVPREENWLQAMSMRLMNDLQQVQQGIFTGQVDEDMWIPDFFLKKAATKRNLYVYPEDEKDLSILDVNKLYTEHEHFLLRQVPVIEAYADSTKENWAVLTVVADVTSGDGAKMLLSALQFRRNNPGVRLEIVHNPPAEGGAEASAVNHALVRSIEALAEAETVEDIASRLAVDAEHGVDDDSFNGPLGAFLSAAKIPRGSRALILNGRVVGPISADSGAGDGDGDFDEGDFQQLLEVEQSQRILPVYAAVDGLGLGQTLSGPIAAAKLTSITALSTISDLPEGIFESAPTLRTSAFDEWQSKHTAIEVGDAETASIHLVGLLDPASEQGQQWAPIIKVLSELEGVYVKLFLNPRERMEELPVKRFYRYVLDSEPTFDESGKVKRLAAHFSGVPSEALLTVGMKVPPAWLVAPKASVHDLDNIKLSSVKSDVEAVYELQNILIEGHSRNTDGKKSAPPSGAQLVLGTEKEPHAADTIIMSNLGFFQFKANPGFYSIQLKEGRSSEIFEIESVGARGYSPVPGDEGTEVALMDFQGTTLYPRIKRKPGMETADVLSDGTDADGADGAEGCEGKAKAKRDSDSGIVAKGLKLAEGLWGGGGSKKAAAPATRPDAAGQDGQEHADINIFSVASGHLYERMLNIMMVSVMRHTNHTVKFWFIEQFLSPSFKDFIPHLAREYGFRYEMVTYKWPHWLRQQKEKQREIWGYKILFLDVLFPLSLDKVIFVDADQIVRADMMDLVNLDLHGAPYGFTPMCDSRVEMEGFRFWKQGYWANYLRGLPYHISALYVVDLRRFRELAAGDRLRQQYHSLSADPNSLANLDQDLPNHMQFVIPIHSLPQEWLWCETWCSDESLPDARTIDLCNNPMTKEPKLDRARRQVPEWTVYDDEIAALDRRRRRLANAKPNDDEDDDAAAAAVSVQEEEQLREQMKAKEEQESKEGRQEDTEGEKEKVERNTKSRNWEEPKESGKMREKDEL